MALVEMTIDESANARTVAPEVAARYCESSALT